MAIYHFSGTVVSRSAGKSAVASAAYRAGEKLYDERQERVVDYSRKQDVVFNEIMLPEKAPEWMKDREKLWNAVEMSENRKDSQLAREFNFALPRELSSAQNIELAKEFVQNEFVSKGMVADLCIHDGKASDGEEQPHAHVMLTMRQVTEEGFGLKERSWNDKENLKKWREAWADCANRHLELNGIDQRIDHKTLEEQGIGLEAQKKIGPNSMRMERIREIRLEEHQRIAKENGDKILEDPSIALNAMTYHKSTFTHQDLARFINRHTIDAEQFQTVYEKVRSSEQMISLSMEGTEKRGVERFTTKDMLALESKMLDDAIELKERSNVVSERPKNLNGGLSNLSSSPNSSNFSGITLSHQQKDALEHIVGAGDIKSLVGYAGTGKSCLLAHAKDIWEKDGYRVHGSTLAGVAAENLEFSSGIESRTLASRCYYWDRGEEKLGKKDVLVIDEAGMLGSRQIGRILDEVREGGAKAVLLGDPQQLQAIEAGAAFRAISEKVGFLELTEVRRQQEPWQQEATKKFALRDTEKALELYEQKGCVHVFETQEEAKTNVVERWNEARISQSDKTQIMLSYTRRDVQELNEMARGCRKENNELGEDHELQTSVGIKEFAIGERIYFLQNDRNMGVKNGTLGSIEKIENLQITVRLDVIAEKASMEKGTRKKEGGEKVVFNIDNYNHITHGYAATIHKAQGVTVDQSHVLASKHLDSHAGYVGMTRHRERADLYWSKEEFSNKRDLERTLGRDRSKDVTTDYLGFDIKYGKNERENKDEIGYDKGLDVDNRDKESRSEGIKRITEKEQDGVDYEKDKRDKIDEIGGEKTAGEADIKILEDFKDFQERFEREHPERAEEIREETEAAKFIQERNEHLVGHKTKVRDIFLEGNANIKNSSKEEIELEAFRRKFEKENPKDAAVAREETMPSLSLRERGAEMLIEKYHRYEERYQDFQERGVSRFNERETKEQLERCGRDICNDKNAMEYLQKRDIELFKEMEQMKELEKTREMQKGFELSL